MHVEGSKPLYKKVLIVGLTSLPRDVVRAILMGTDIAITLVSLLIADLLFLTSWSAGALWIYPLLIAIDTCWIIAFRLNRIKLVMLNSRDILNIARASFMMAMSFLVVSLILDEAHVAQRVVVFGIFSFAGMVGVRSLAVASLGHLRGYLHKRQNVAIFGAGAAGIQLASALNQSADMRVAAFFDDNPTMQGMEIGGVPVWSPSQLVADLFRHSISKLVVALPDHARARRNAIVEICDQAGIEVQILPSFFDLLADRGSARLRTVDPHELLGRGKVDLDTPEVAKSYAGRVVMVTGAGGSIGSELCRQLLNCRPAKIVLYEQSEYNLYAADMELQPRALKRNVRLVSCLGSVTDPDRLRHVMRSEGVEIVLHAAAYKHVPMIEENELEGARNNVLGTKVAAEIAVEEGVERFILISSDKAVRPSSVMGATKRIAELVIQDIQTRAPATKFAMVRFGNVLGSSGSVLPLFQAQIEAGGPVTVTDPEVRRYFMTITEAARLVLLAGAYAEGGDVFVLDMGEPQKIISLARKMIQLSGRRVLDPKTGEGEIEIKIVGLRPGEKLFEELLADFDNLRKTPHPKIMRAEEAMLSQIEVAALLREIQAAINTSDPQVLRNVVLKRVDGYQPSVGVKREA
ncbi:polysaccharide biosynthesis protein [Celeribacter neptunius]|uniref:NDP-sugar epimerase, includes UDP-GlcNAc-inverting 4,6-dehydratase FlaA1 and capsular polysaccharide biosynthesis protein EpsC n=1 Tax=Celeribacter neptunius TaxID=588602 RepID=A0A1I3WW18_9RHOB|nr:nucleoside-diphosphate sugar epimerase/dehydratase [Celeribacter neptunius]SFK11097.1 NDP-sugar epimerase, includes UDP-GlcNAc-inverting 4,6-dehydratase FlaA1 and capsular polysaccharide biosynthesis protein EpsC [Celeribacter neptunius]